MVLERQVQTLSLYRLDSTRRCSKTITELNLSLQSGCQIFPCKSVRRFPVISMSSSSGIKIPNFNL
jgi:hypothetical protein